MGAEDKISVALQRALVGYERAGAETPKQVRERRHRAWCSDKYCEDEAHKNAPKPKEGEKK